MTKQEVYISVDVETAGPVPGEFSMLTLGACCVDDPQKKFVCSFKPINENFVPEALEVTGLSLAKLAVEGLSPDVAMNKFAAWINCSFIEGQIPVFVGLNAPFDWSFVNYYFHRFTGANPFGFTALDIKALFMGATGCTWRDTRSSSIARRVHPTLQGDHDALHDALYQAELFRLIRQLPRA
jgi:DNA polymerase III epsilon subunit-like protein